MNKSENRILLLGASGQVGRELALRLPELGSLKAPGRGDCDLAVAKEVNSLLADYSPNIIVNAAAYTAVDKAETETDLARRLNTELPAQLAHFAAEQGAILVDFSTDYIFDGTKDEPWVETDVTEPVNGYGQSKLAGLQAIQESGCQYLVFIVSWVYSAEGQNFPRTMLRLAKERSELKVVADQFGAPTPADWIASTTVASLRQVLAEPSKCGLYNMSPAGSTNWADFARETLQSARESGVKLQMGPEQVVSISADQYPTPAKRPENSVLNSAKLREAFAVATPHWRLLFRRQGSISW